MLQYRRCNKTASYVEESLTPLLTYCNWSYTPDYYMDLTTLQNI